VFPVSWRSTGAESNQFQSTKSIIWPPQVARAAEEKEQPKSVSLGEEQEGKQTSKKRAEDEDEDEEGRNQNIGTQTGPLCCPLLALEFLLSGLCAFFIGETVVSSFQFAALDQQLGAALCVWGRRLEVAQFKLRVCELRLELPPVGGWQKEGKREQLGPGERVCN